MQEILLRVFSSLPTDRAAPGREDRFPRMVIPMSRLSRLLLLLLPAFLLLAACGQKGDLYLPEQTDLERRAGR